MKMSLFHAKAICDQLTSVMALNKLCFKTMPGRVHMPNINIRFYIRAFF